MDTVDLFGVHLRDEVLPLFEGSALRVAADADAGYAEEDLEEGEIREEPKVRGSRPYETESSNIDICSRVCRG